MTAKEEKLLAGGARGNGVSIIDSIIKSCMPNLPITVDELLTNDKYFILLVLRAQSYGSEYKFGVKCGNCDKKFTHEVNLGFTTEEEFAGEFEEDNSFYVKTLSDDTEEPFTVKLPSSGDTIKFRLLRGRDEKQIQRFAENLAAKGRVEGDPSYIYRLSKHIVSIEDKELDSFAVQAYVENMIGRDSIALRDAIEAADCGVDTTVKATCVFCDEQTEFALPMTAEFFRPRG
jgi:hypothetical protein